MDDQLFKLCQSKELAPFRERYLELIPTIQGREAKEVENFNSSYFRFACGAGNLPVAQFLFNYCQQEGLALDPNAKYSNALAFALRGHHLEVVRWLVSIGAEREFGLWGNFKELARLALLNPVIFDFMEEKLNFTNDFRKQYQKYFSSVFDHYNESNLEWLLDLLLRKALKYGLLVQSDPVVSRYLGIFAQATLTPEMIETFGLLESSHPRLINLPEIGYGQAHAKSVENYEFFEKKRRRGLFNKFCENNQPELAKLVYDPQYIPGPGYRYFDKLVDHAEKHGHGEIHVYLMELEDGM